MGLQQVLKSISSYRPAWWANGGPSGSGLYSLQDPGLSRFFTGIGSASPKMISLSNAGEIVAAWEQCPPVVSIITGKASADITGKIAFNYLDSEEEVNLSKQPTARAMSKLMAKPNPLQTWRQFRAQQKVYTQLFGFCPVLTIKPVGFTGPESVKMMWNLPPQYVTIHTSGKLFYQADKSGIIERIEIKYDGKSQDLPVEDIFILKDQYTSLRMEVVPSARICTLSMPISNIIQAYVGANVMLVKRGAIGILSNSSKDTIGTLPLKQDEKEELQADFQRYGLNPEQAQIIITNASLEWQQMAISVKDLMLYEAIEDGTRQCCSVFNYPYGLIPKSKNDSFHNKAEDKKSLYSDAIIPEADSDMEVYNDFFQLATKGILMRLDYSHLEVFQVSESDKATAMKGKAEAADLMFKSEAITLRRMREMLGENTTADDEVYYSEWTKRNQPEQVDNQNQNQDEPAVTE